MAWYIHSFLFTQGDANSIGSGKYNIGSTRGFLLDGDKLRELPDPIPCGDRMVPDPDSIPLSVLNYPTGKKHEINFAAYGPPELTLFPPEGAHPMLVFYFDSSLKVLISK